MGLGLKVPQAQDYCLGLDFLGCTGRELSWASEDIERHPSLCPLYALSGHNTPTQSYDNDQKCLQTLPNVPGQGVEERREESPHGENCQPQEKRGRGTQLSGHMEGQTDE